MGRPLRKDTIDAMQLKVESGETLSKQVGYNKYRTLEDEERIVRLAEEAEGDNVVLLLRDGENDYPVLKIVQHLFHTTGGIYPYTIDAEGKVDFGSANITVYESKDPTPTLKVTCSVEGAVIKLNGETASEITVQKNTDVVVSISGMTEYKDFQETIKVDRNMTKAYSAENFEKKTFEVTIHAKLVEEGQDVNATFKVADETVEMPYTAEYGDSVTFAISYKEDEDDYAGEKVVSNITADVEETVVLEKVVVEEPGAPEELNPEPGE